MDIIDQVYSNVYVQRAIVICKSDSDVLHTRKQLHDNDYPIFGSSVDAIKMIVLTMDDFHNHPCLMLDKTSVIFTFDLDHIGVLCNTGIPLVVALPGIEK